MKIRYEIERNCGRENSFGPVGERATVTLQVTVWLPDCEQGPDDRRRGGYEFFDLESRGERFYAEGELNFEGKELVDYDGMYCLSDFILDTCEENGFDVDEMRGILYG